MAQLNRAQRGLYGGKTKQFGNQISHSMRHTRRTWKPNVHPKRLWSEALQRKVRLRVTTHVLRTIDLYGGLDEYLLGTRDTKIDSVVGVQIKNAIREELRKKNALTNAGDSVVVNKM